MTWSLLLSLVGATLIVTSSTILAPVRKLWPALLRCSQCTGMWIGALAGASGIASMDCERVMDAFLVGCAVSCAAQLTDAVLTALLGETNDSA